MEIVEDIHSKLVENWLMKEGKALPPEQRVLLLEQAILAIELRASMTLSSITLMVILDRVLHQTKENYPILSKATIDSYLLNFKEIHQNINQNSQELALTSLLTELLRVLGRITADILTIPLHKELNKVTWNDLERK